MLTCYVLQDETDDDAAWYQTTKTQHYLYADWVCGRSYNDGKFLARIVGHVHYRLVLAEAGYPLVRFTGTSELLHATYDAFRGELSSHACDDQ